MDGLRHDLVTKTKKAEGGTMSLWWFIGGIVVGCLAMALGLYVWIIKNVHPW